MRRAIRLMVTLNSVLLPLASGAQPGAAKPKSAGSVKSKAAKRGEYLVRAAGCNDCHTPWIFNKDLKMPVPDMSRMLSGHPAGAPDPGGTLGPQDIGLIGPTFTSFKMPFGIVYSANLTPDKDTGLGSWSEASFVKAFRNGKHFGGNGRAILPPMPWLDVASLSDEDLKAIFAYLRSIPPIRNAVPDHQVPIPAIEAITESTDKMLKGASAAPH